MKILVTGVAGFIGAVIAKKLLEQCNEVVGIDNLNDFYDVQLKKDKLESILVSDKFKFIKLDFANQKDTEDMFRTTNPERVLRLTAQAGVRYSLVNPHVYVRSNLKNYLGMQLGDVLATYADVGDLVKDANFAPDAPLRLG